MYPGALLLRARSLAVFGLSGAIVLQADKLIISGFNGSSAVIAYYLANTLCLVPISSLAGPVASYFQPGVLSSIGSRSQTSTFIQLKRMLLLLSGVTLPPTVAIWLFRDDIIRIWLVGSPNAGQVAEYTAILLPGVCIGAFGFIPYLVLLARGDHRFQARMSGFLTVLTLVSTIGFGYQGNIKAICWVYAIYHSSSTIFSWLRWIALERYESSNTAKTIGLYTLLTLSITLATTWFGYFIL